MRRERRRAGLVGLAALVAVGVGGAPALAAGAPTGAGSAAPGGSETGRPYPCAPHTGQSINGPFADAGALGWAGNAAGVVACLGGSFYVQNGIDTTYGYGVYNHAATTWTNVDGYLPALQTSFRRSGLTVAITNFGDEVQLASGAYVAVYSRVAVHNPTSHAVSLDPQPSPGLLPLNAAPDGVRPGATVDHDYVVAADRFGQPSPWPSPDALRDAGGYDAHFAHIAPSGTPSWTRSPRSACRARSSRTPTAAGTSTPRSRGAATTSTPA